MIFSAYFPKELVHPRGVRAQHIKKFMSTVSVCSWAWTHRRGCANTFVPLRVPACWYGIPLQNSCWAFWSFFYFIIIYIFFLEEFQVRDVGVEKIYDLIISLIFLMDFHASALAPHGCLFSFLLQSGLRCSAPKSVTECPCPEQDFFLLFFPWVMAPSLRIKMK